MAQLLPTPYCGAPPVPDQLWSRWNLDPVLIGALVLALGLYLARAGRAGLGRTQVTAFCAGWAVVGGALISPLCALSVALFSARVGQHMVLSLVAAPLIALGRPWQGYAIAWPGRQGKPPRATAHGQAGLWAAAAFGLALWVWHAPGPYGATFHSDLVYWLMHLSLFGTALWLWSALLHETPQGFAVTAGATAFTAVQMGVLGAVVTFAERPIYAWHLTTTWAWGLSPLEDQQLGGAIMWAPSGAVFAAGLAVAFAATLRRGSTATADTAA